MGAKANVSFATAVVGRAIGRVIKHITQIAEHAPLMDRSLRSEMYERVSTVAANAYVGPCMSAYLGELTEPLDHHGFGGAFFVVQSTGGLFPVEHARRDCMRMRASEPAAGVDRHPGDLPAHEHASQRSERGLGD